MSRLPLAVFRERAIRATVSRQTQETYSRTVSVLKDNAAISVDGFLSFVQARWGKRSEGKICAATLACYKSALMHELRAVDRTWQNDGEGWRDVDEVLKGLAAMEDERPVRGALEDEKMWEVVGRAHQLKLSDVADGLVVISGCILRPRDITEMRRDQLDLDRNLVWVRSKKRVTNRNRAEYEAHTIYHAGAKKILERRFSATRSGRLFPQWTVAAARAVVKSVAKEKGWNNGSVVFDGPHSCRHGGAVERRRMAEREVQQGGGWKSMTTAVHYGRERRRTTE